jgi:hypothetical protein
MASTSGDGSLAGLLRLAKSKIQTSFVLGAAKKIDHTLSLAIDGEKIAAIYLVRNPDKLRHAPDAAPGARPN